MTQRSPKVVKCPHCGAGLEVSADAAPGTRVSCACGRGLVLRGTVGGGAATAPPPSALADQLAAYGVRRRRPVAQDEATEQSPLREVYFPAALIVAGAAVWVAQSVFRPLGASVGAGLVVGLLLFVVSVAVMLVGVFAAAWFMGVEFGSVPSVVFKLAATAVFATGAFAILASLDLQSGRGPLLGYHAAILVYAVSFKTMFDLDVQEAAMTVGIIALLQALAALVIFQSRAG
jgi:hypothetical protein